MRKIKKGDTVEVIAGKDKGKRGKVLKVQPKTNRVIVEGEIFTPSYETSQEMPQDGFVKMEGPIHISNVSWSVPVVIRKPG